MRSKSGADGEYALPFFQFAKRTIHKASQRESAGLRGLEWFGQCLRLTRIDDGLHWVGRSNGDQTCAGSQRCTSGEDGRAAFSDRTGEQQHVAVGSFVRIGCADEGQRCELCRLGPTSGTLTDFLHQRGGRADLTNFEIPATTGLIGQKLTNLRSRKRDSLVREQNGPFRGLAIGWRTGGHINGKNKSRSREPGAS